MTSPPPDNAKDVAARRIVLVTGVSGAGMSTALKGLEDIGYEAVDNLPLFLVEEFLFSDKSAGRDAVALGVDCRTRDFDAGLLLDIFARINAREGVSAELVFIDCDDAALQRRFTETRRRHPLAIDRPVEDAIRHERTVMAPLGEHVTLRIDTTALSIHDLRRIIANRYRLNPEGGLMVFVQSFGFKKGLPRDADLVFDVRFLDNPHFVPDLRPLTGRDAPVAAHVASDPGYPDFFEKLTGLLEPLLPRYHLEGKSYLTIAIGCTGGRHRSVYVCEELFKWLEGKKYSAGIRHRDLEN